MIFHILLLLCVLVPTTVTVQGATAAYSPTDVFLFNCGSNSDSIDKSGRNWTVENRKTLPSNSVNASFFSDALNQGQVPQVPYMKARIFRSAFTYNFPVFPGWKFLRLYFYPTQYGSGFNAVDSFFAVTVNGYTLLKNFSADLTAKASNSEFFIKEFIVPVNTTLALTFTTLALTFTPSLNSLAFVNGIEIVSMPDRFYSKGGFDDEVTTVGSNIQYPIENLTAFETVHRLNVGGQMVDDIRDSGMFRRWLADVDFLLSENSGILINIPEVKINYSEKTPAYVAPEDVYNTARGMGNPTDPSINLNFNLTWRFEVDAGFDYLVRLHFCETLHEVNKTGQLIFTISIGNQTAMANMDVIFLSGGYNIPMYLDFKIYLGPESGPVLRLDLYPNEELVPMYYDALLNGVEILKMSDFDRNLAGPNPNPSQLSPTPKSVMPSGRKGNKSHVLAIILAVVGSAIVLAMFVVVVFILKKKKKKKNDFSVHTTSKPLDSWAPLPNITGSTQTRSTISLPSDLCRRFSIHEIKSATNDFEKKLIVGVGGFGPVFKGRIDGGATLVAVKRLEVSSSQGANEFETELKMLSMLRHKHLVSLIGFCDDENEMVLVYEYMPRGTIKDHLYKRNKTFDPPLSWKQRLEICIGAAHGLHYLHSGAKHTIIHRDIKTTNILLDDNYVAKVSDFGLSKMGATSASQTHISTNVKGTFGYLDPEYYRRQVLTEKSDVYSFGVVLFEVLCCRPVKVHNVPAEQGDLIRWVKLNYEKGTIDQIIDPDLTADITSTSLEKFCEIAVRCVHDRGMERPTMNDVVWALDFALQLHETAKKKTEDMEPFDLIKRADENLSRRVIGTTTDEEDDFFSKTTGHVADSTTTNDHSARLLGNSESSWGVFSEIKDPKAR